MPLSDDLTAALRSAPELSSTPGIALASAQTQDPVGNAQAAAYSTNAQAMQGAVANQANVHHGGHGFLGHTLSWLSDGWNDVRHIAGEGVGGIMHLANAGLQDVQHQYRYMHDLIVKHGWTAGLLEATPLIVGASAGALLAPVTGGLSVAVAAGLGAEVAGGVTARLNPIYHDSWTATTNGDAYRDPHSGLPVSPGRDLAALFGLKEHKGLDMFSAVSAIGDGVFDLTTDPAAKFLAGAKELNVARRAGTAGISTAELAEQQGVKLSKVSRALVRPEDFDKAYNDSRGVRNAVDDMTGLTSGQILTRYPKFADLAARLGPASTVDDVKQVFRNALGAAEITGATGGNPFMISDLAPTRNVLSALGVGAKIKVQELQGPLKWAKAQLGMLPEMGTGTSDEELIARIKAGAEREGIVGRMARTMTNQIPVWKDYETGAQIKGGLDIMSPDAGRVTYDVMRAVGAPHSVAEDVATSLMNSPTEPGRRAIFKSMSLQGVLARAKEANAGNELEPDFVQQLSHEWNERTPQGIEAGRNAKYDYDLHGRDLSKVTTADGSEFTAGTMASDLGLTAIPDYRYVRELVRGKNNINQLLGKSDDFFAHHFTENIFKPLVLVQPGTSVRIAAGEASTAIARHGLRNYFGALVRTSILKSRGAETLASEVSDQEVNNVLGAVSQLRGGIDWLGDRLQQGFQTVGKPLAGINEEQLANDIKYVDFHGGQFTPASMQPGHGISEIIGKQNQIEDTLHTAAQEVPKNQRLSNDFAGFGQTDPMHAFHWQAWLRRLSKDEATQKAAGAYLDELERGAERPAGFRIFRHDVEGAELSPAVKPHGTYYSLHEGEGPFVSPHEETGGPVLHEHIGTAQNPLEVPEARIQHARFKGVGGGSGEVSAGVAALKQLASPEEFERLRTISKPDLVDELTRRWPGPDYSQYHDSYELLEAAGAQMARDTGHDAIILRDTTAPEFSEYVALHPSAVSTTETAEDVAQRATRAAAAAHTAHWAAQPEEVLERYHRNVMTADPMADPHTEWGQTVAEAIKGATHTPFREGVPAAVGGVAPTIEGGAYGTAREAVQARQAGEWSDHLLSGEKGSDFLDDAYGRGTKYEVPVPKGDTVTVYRAVPTGETAIRPGQYVSASRVYAEEHLEQHLSGLSTENPALAQGGHVISTEIPKSELGLAGANELIWVPSELPASEAARETALAARSAPGGAVPNLDLLKAVRDGKVVSKQTLDAIPVPDRPLMVPGRTLVPAFDGTVQKIAAWGNRNFMKRIVGTFARDPMYRLEYEDQFNAFKPLIEDGTIHDSEAQQYAASRAMNKMSGLIHNPAERSLFSANVTNWIPFYYAQEQAYRRMGRLLLEDPGAFRKQQLAMSALHDIAHPPPDENGQPQGSIFMPGAGFLGKTVPGIMNAIGFHTLGSVPVGFSGSLQSLQSVSPLVEDIHANLGPLAVFVGKTVAHLFPETTQYVDKVLGPEAAAGGAWESLIPNTTLRRVWDAQRMDSRSNQAAMMHIVQLESYKQEQADAKWVVSNPEPELGTPDHDAWDQKRLTERENIVPLPSAPAMEKQAFLDRLKNHTRILDYVKAAIGFVSPMAPQYKFGDNGLSEELTKMANAKVKAGGTFAGALQDFLLKNPEATPYTVFQSENADNSPIQASSAAQQWIDANRDLIGKYPMGAAYLVPQGGKRDSAVYNEQLAMGVRRKRTPEEFLKQIYIAQGNAGFYDGARRNYIQALQQYKGNTAATKDINQQWTQYVADKGIANPVWLDDYQSVDRQNAKKRAMAELQTIFANNEAPTGPQTDAVKTLLDGWNNYQAAGMPGRRDQVALRMRKQLDGEWEQYLDTVVNAAPELAPLVNRLFRDMSDKDRQLAGLGERPV